MFAPKLLFSYLPLDLGTKRNMPGADPGFFAAFILDVLPFDDEYVPRSVLGVARITARFLCD